VPFHFNFHFNFYSAQLHRIVITGPESSGKTTLTASLSTAFDAISVPEYARHYLESKGRDYTLSDIVNIAVGQLALAEAIAETNQSKSYMFIDTWMLELRIWAQYRYDAVPDLIESLYHAHQPDFYVLCSPDIEWQPDPLRENPHDRDVLFKRYHSAIIDSGVPCVVISGSGEERHHKAVEAVKRWLEG